MTRSKVLTGGRWVIVGIILRNTMLFGILIVLTRLLPPDDFGLIAMLALFVGASAALTEAGLGAALIQVKDPTDLDKSTLFWTQIGLGALMGIALAIAGPWLAALFEQPVLAALAVAYGVNTMVSSLIPIQNALFVKKLDFKPVIRAQLAAELVSGGTAIAAAVLGAGVWALYLQAFGWVAMITVVLWYFSPWRPGFAYSMASLRKCLGFGLYAVGSSVLLEVELRIGAFFLGQVSSPAATGFFQRASSLRQELAKSLSGAITKVAFPTFSALQEDRGRFLSALRQALFINMLVGSLAMWTLALAAAPAVTLVFGETWLPMATPLQAFCVAAGFHPYFVVFEKALRATGHARLTFLQYLLRATLTTIVAASVATQGGEVLAWALTTLFLLLIPVYAVTAARHLGYGLRLQVLDLAPILSAGAVLLAVATSMGTLSVIEAEPLRLLALFAISLGCFIASVAAWYAFTPMLIGRKSIVTMMSFIGRKAQ